MSSFRLLWLSVITCNIDYAVIQNGRQNIAKFCIASTFHTMPHVLPIMNIIYLSEVSFIIYKNLKIMCNFQPLVLYLIMTWFSTVSSQEHFGILNHRQCDCLFCLFGLITNVKPMLSFVRRIHCQHDDFSVRCRINILMPVDHFTDNISITIEI